MSAELLLAFSEHLLSHAGGLDDEISRVLDVFSLHIIPAADMDGVMGLRPGNCSASGRGALGQGIEDFREEDGMCRPETRALSMLLSQRGFSLVVQLRGGQAEEVLVPQGTLLGGDSMTHTQQDVLTQRLASEYLSGLRGQAPVSCPAAQDVSSGIVPSTSPASLANHVWDKFGHTLFVAPGIGALGGGCCAAPNEKDMSGFTCLFVLP